MQAWPLPSSLLHGRTALQTCWVVFSSVLTEGCPSWLGAEVDVVVFIGPCAQSQVQGQLSVSLPRIRCPRTGGPTPTH